MPIVTIGIDLAKNVLAIHGVDEAGQAKLIKPRVARDQLVTLIAQLPACLIGMEACSGAHHWARVFQQHGHTVKLMAPYLVAPYRMSGKRGKNDAADAAAICEAVTRRACVSCRTSAGNALPASDATRFRGRTDRDI
ncbi:transposase [Paraburkholderia sp. WSM4179]|nr:transposase [Paraburkholderia sp. WSM4179]